MSSLYIGIDVQVQRKCAFAVVNEGGTLIDSGWFATAAAGFQCLEPLAKKHTLHIGIDAPRMPISSPRKFYWNGAKRIWREKTAADKGLGRHCEVAVKAHNLANPQWTPLKKDAPDWMRLGFELFQSLEKPGTTYEAFPSAAYTLLEHDCSLQLNINFSNVRKGPKDMLDAWMAAATVREFAEGRGFEMGGGDGLGSIILPRKPAVLIPEVLQWP